LTRQQLLLDQVTACADGHHIDRYAIGVSDETWAIWSAAADGDLAANAKTVGALDYRGRLRAPRGGWPWRRFECRLNPIS
jgi:hypothetical protein